MSDIAMNTPDASQTGGSANLGNKPDTYHGDRNKLEAWLLQVDRYFHLQGDRIEDDNKVVLATTYLRGDAEKWANPILQRYMDDSIEDADNTALVEDWDAFKTKMRQNFSPFKESVVAEQKIQTLQQTGPAADYTTLFQQYATRIDWDDNALMRMYKQGLKPSVRKELMRTGTSVTNLEELMTEAVRLDNELYELALEERLFAKGTRKTGSSNDRSRQNQYRRSQPNTGKQRNYTPRTPGAYRGYGAEPMHLDNLNKGKGPGRNNKEQSKKTFNCYKCGKEGHMVRDCRSTDTNKVKRQLNVMRRKSELDDDEKWNIITRPTLTAPEGEEELLKGFEDITITAPEASDEDGEPPSDEEYETPEETEEPQTPKTKYQKMASFKEKHRPATPARLPSRDNTYYVETQIRKMNEILDQEHHIYDHTAPGVLLQMYHDMWYLRSEIDFYEIKTTQTLPDYAHITANINRLQGRTHQCKKHSHQPCKQEKTDIPQWAQKAREAWTNDNIYQISQHWYNANNPQHSKLHWTACTTEFCPAHWNAKQNEGWSPKKVRGEPTCKWAWYECRNDLCAKHLWKKRETIHFPGHTNETKDIIDMQITYANEDGVTRECNQPHWQTCLSNECDKHQDAKEYHGYAEPQSFLGQRQEDAAPPGKSTQ
jgi:hypothetical protein